MGTMAARFSDGEKPAEGATQLDEIKDSFLALVDADAEAYDLVLSAKRLPKETEEEKGRRAGALQNALMEAADIPLRGMRLCVEALETLRGMAKMINKNLCVDLAVSAGLLEAGLIGCEQNKTIAGRRGPTLRSGGNLPGVTRLQGHVR